MKRLLPAFALLFVCQLLLGQTLPSFVTDSLDAYCKKGIADWKIPGMAVAIVKDGKVVFIKGYGVREIGKPDAVDENTLFMIGSNTKAFTATSLAMLELEKKLSLDDKVTKWIPYFKLDNALAGQEATVRDLLCHRIGFETFQGDFTYWSSNLSRKEVIEKMGLVHALYGFRTKWGYCNAAFVAAGEVVQATSGKTWEDYVRETILKPLTMNRTVMLAAELPKATNTATPYTIVEGKLTRLQIPTIDNLAPAGTISSSVSDMTHWLIAQLDGGKYEGKQVIPPAAIAATRTPQSILGLDTRDKRNTHFQLYGLGLGLSDRAGKVVVSHTGGVDGFLSAVTLIPEERLGIVVLTNSDQNSFFFTLTQEIGDSFLHLPYSGYSKAVFKEFTENQKREARDLDSVRTIIKKKNKPSLDLSQFSGTYENTLYGDVTVVQKTNQLEIQFSHHPQLTGRLEFLQNDTFLCTYSVPTFGVKAIPFHVEGGKVKGFTLRAADFVEFTPYEFVKKI